MKIYGSVFIIVKHQGDYDEYRAENILACKTKALADHFKHRYECAFQYLHEFYYSKAQEIQEKYPDIMKAPNDVWNDWNNYSNKKRKYYGANFEIEEIKLRRF